jgi:glutamate dehydrogenase/leucine dehydrogenase
MKKIQVVRALTDAVIFVDGKRHHKTNTDNLTPEYVAALCGVEYVYTELTQSLNYWDRKKIEDSSETYEEVEAIVKKNAIAEAEQKVLDAQQNLEKIKCQGT